MNYWQRATAKRLNRRSFIHRVGYSGAGLAGLVAVGCGNDDDDAASGNGNGGSGGSGGGNGAPTTGTDNGNGSGHQVGGDLRTAYSGNWSQLDPLTGSGGTDHQALWPVFDNLVSYDPEFNLDENRSLASGWEIQDEGMAIALTLREGVEFHDGEPFNGEAVRTHIEYGQSEPTSTVQADLGAIEDVEVIDDHSIVLHLAKPFSPLLRVLGDRAGMIISPRAIEEFGANLDRTPIGTGAFEFVEEVLDSRYQLRAWDRERYWQQGCPSLDTLEWALGVDPTQQTSGLLSGQFNVLWDPDPTDLAQIESAGFTVRTVATPTNGVFFFNVNMPPWDNVHVRRAVQYGIDRETLVETVWNGVHDPGIYGWLGPATGVYHDPSFEGYSYDPDRVREELEAAGLPDGFEADVNVASTATGIAQGELIQANLREFGININLQAKPTPDYFREYYDLEVPAFVASMSARADIWQQVNYVHGVGGAFDVGAIPEGGDPELEALFDEVEAIYDEEERVPVMRELHDRVHELSWFCVLYHQNAVAAHDPTLQFELFADGKPHFGQCEVHFSE